MMKWYAIFSIIIFTLAILLVLNVIGKTLTLPIRMGIALGLVGVGMLIYMSSADYLSAAWMY